MVQGLCLHMDGNVVAALVGKRPTNKQGAQRAVSVNICSEDLYIINFRIKL